MVGTLDELWQAALQQELPLTLQVTFPTLLWVSESQLFSKVFAEIPQHFPHLKINTVGRGLHSTLLYLDGMKLADMKKVFEFLKKIDRATLEKYDLARPFKVFDPANPRLVRAGTKSRFIGLAPDQEYISAQLRFYQMLKDLAPELLEIHLSHHNLGEALLSAGSVHFSLVQYGASSGIYLTPEQELEVENRLLVLLKESAAEIAARVGPNAATVYFSFLENPIQLVTAPKSIMSLPMEVASIRFSSESGEMRLSAVSRWDVKQNKTNESKTLDFNTEKFLAGEARPYVLKDPELNDLPPLRRFQPMTVKNFKKLITSDRLKDAYDIALKTLSPTKHPASAPVGEASRRRQFFLTSIVDGEVNPRKGFEALEMARLLNIKSTAKIDIGRAIYASAIRDDIKNPSDVDLLVSSLVHVPDEVSTVEEAQKFVVDAFTEDVLGQLIKAAKSKEVAIVELRLSSADRMGIKSSDVISDKEDNTYLSEQDIIDGKYRDKNGRLWTIKELIAHREFIKGKVDFFPNGPMGRREPLSLQFLVGYKWKGATYFFQRDALKGMPPLARTAMYDGADSFAISAAFHRQWEYYATQKGSFIPRSIRDLLRTGYSHVDMSSSDTAPAAAEPLWATKFLKRFYNFLRINQKSPLGLDEFFWKHTREVLKRDQKWSENYSIKELKGALLTAINQPELKTISEIKHVVNDLREYNERGWRFRDDMWRSRQTELNALFVKFIPFAMSHEAGAHLEFWNAFHDFREFFARANALPSEVEALKFLSEKAHYRVLKEFEQQLGFLEARIVQAHLRPIDKAFISTMASDAPAILFDYIDNRSQESDFKIEWMMRFLGIEPTQENISLIRELATKKNVLTRKEVASLQARLYKVPANSNPPAVEQCANLIDPPAPNRGGDMRNE